MNKMFIKINILATLPLILILYFNIITKSSVVCKEVNSKQEAIKIAQSYVFNEYQQHFEDYDIIAELEDDIWIVFYMKPFTFGGSGPVVRINKLNGDVIGCGLQK